MTRRLLFLALAAGLLSLSFGSLDARAGQIPLPTTLDQLLPAGNFAVVGPGTGYVLELLVQHESRFRLTAPVRR